VDEQRRNVDEQPAVDVTAQNDLAALLSAGDATAVDDATESSSEADVAAESDAAAASSPLPAIESSASPSASHESPEMIRHILLLFFSLVNSMIRGTLSG
jgi:hypothetical protein